MPSHYDPKDHIQHLAVAPRAEGILDQREITIHSYETTVPFDYEAINMGLESAWLTPVIRFGVFSRGHGTSRDDCAVVLGLQDELSVRAYDYEARRPLWYSWQDVIVDTAGIRYFKNEDGLLQFTTTGGGRRITDDRLHEFNSAFLKIPKEAVTRRCFDLAKLRDLCFSRFVDRLYMVRFSDPSGEEYRSIDHALFQSRQYIDPEAKRLQEVRADAQVRIESFDSDISVRSEELAEPIQIRFFIRGLSGALRLRLPKLTLKNQLTAPEEQARIVYHIVDVAVGSILDADYYAQHRHSLDSLSTDLGMFPDMIDLAPFRDALTTADARKQFIQEIDVGAPWNEWLPHLRAIDELLPSVNVADHVGALLADLTGSKPLMAARLLAECQVDAKLSRVGRVAAKEIASRLQALPAEVRAHVEETLLAWVIDCERDTWDVDPSTGEITALTLRWQIESLAFDVLPAVIWKLMGALHARLQASEGDVAPLLRKFNWCVEAAKGLPEFYSKSRIPLRLIATRKVPRSVADGARVLKEAVKDAAALDEAMLSQFGLPLWPYFELSHSNTTIVLSNSGIGAALAMTAQPAGMLFSIDEDAPTVDLIAGEATPLPLKGSGTAVDVRFRKLGREYRATLPLPEAPSPTVSDTIRSIPAAIKRSRLSAQLKYRDAIDPQKIVVGASPGLLEVFERIHHANLLDGCAAVLLLGEPGVGKTHIARLLHDSSERAKQAFKVVNAGGGGGDLNIQRGEWIGYGKGHGIQGIEKSGRPGHLMSVGGGTLFVDEFAALSHDLQLVFLSVLEGRAIEKVGGESFAPNVRCVFATNADVDDAVAKGHLRRDLLDRIAMRILIPPLRDRRGDILMLARHFAANEGMTDRCLVGLIRHRWPANVRGLQMLMANAVARKKSADASAIDLEHCELPDEIVAEVTALDEGACRRELWVLADESARNEGFAHGAGLQRRAGEIMGVCEAQASKMYRTHGLAVAPAS